MFCFDSFQIKLFKFSLKLFIFNFCSSYLFFFGGWGEAVGGVYMFQNYFNWKELFQVKLNTLL